MGKKFIIELEDEPFLPYRFDPGKHTHEVALWRVKGFRSLVFDEDGLKKLKPYEEHDRDCDKCIWSTRSGGCSSWDCEFVDKREAYKAWKEKQGNEQA